MNTKDTKVFINSEQYGGKRKMAIKKKTTRKVKAGEHMMPNGKMMKDSEMKKMKTKMKKKMGY